MALVILPNRAVRQGRASALNRGLGAWGQHVLYSAYTSLHDYSRPPVAREPGTGADAGITDVTLAPAPFGIAASFNGTTSVTGVSRIPSLLQPRITISWWMYVPSFTSTTTGAFAYNISGQTAENNNGFYFSPNHSSGNMVSVVGKGGLTTVAQWPRPSAGAWHHLVWGIDKSVTGSNVSLVIDGINKSIVSASNAGASSAWGQNSLYFGCYNNGSALFCNCRIANFYIFNALLPINAAVDLYVNQYQLMFSQRRYYVPAAAIAPPSSNGTRWFLMQ